MASVHYRTCGNSLSILPSSGTHGHINATGNQLIYDNDVRKVIERIIVKGSITVTGDCSRLFMDFIRLREFGFMGKMEFTDITNMRLMFNGCWMLSDLDDISRAQWDTSRVTDMSYLFSNCLRLQNINGLAKMTWDTSQVVDMSHMFECCFMLMDIDGLAHAQWDTSNVTDMSYMFSGCSKLEGLDGIAAWDTGKVENLGADARKGVMHMSGLNDNKLMCNGINVGHLPPNQHCYHYRDIGWTPSMIAIIEHGSWV